MWSGAVPKCIREYKLHCKSIATATILVNIKRADHNVNFDIKRNFDRY